MTKEEMQKVEDWQWGDDIQIKAFTQTAIRLAEQELTWEGRENANSLRDFWYNPMKALYETAFPHKHGGPGTEDFNRKMSQNLSGVLSDMVKDGELTYRDLNIVDNSRKRRLKNDTIESDKVIFVEKDSAYTKLKPLEEVYDLSIVSGSGWQATAMIEDMVTELDDDGPFTVWLLSDYDPTGFGIAEDFIERSQLFGLELTNPSPEDMRIGIWPRHLEEQTIDRQKFRVATKTDSDWRWVDEYGIDGPYGLEIEAVGDGLQGKAEALRRLVVSEIRDDIRESERRAADTGSSTASGASGAAEDILQPLTTALKSRAAELVGSDPGFNRATYDSFDNTLTVYRKGHVLLDDQGDYTAVPYDEGELHEGAVEGEPPRVSSLRTQENVREALVEEIEDGDFDLKETIMEEL